MKAKFFLILAFLLLVFIRLEKIVILISSRFPFFILVPSLFLLIIILTLVIVLIKKFTFSEFFKLAKRNLVYISVLFLSCLSIFLILSLNNKLVLNKNLSYPIVKLPSDFATSSDLVRNGVLYIDNSKQKNTEITSGPYVHLPDGIYSILLYYSASPDLKAKFKVLIKKGRVPLTSGQIDTTRNLQKVSFTAINGNGADIEFKIYYDGTGKLEIEKYEILPENTSFFFFLNLFKNILNGVSLFLFLLAILIYVMQRFKIDQNELLKEISIVFSLILFLWIPFSLLILNIIKSNVSFLIVNLIFILFFIALAIQLFRIYYLRLESLEKRLEFLRDLKIKSGILLLAFVVRVIGINNGLPEINLHQDEMDLLERALIRFFINSDINPHPYFHLGTYSYLQSPFYAFFTILGMLSGKIFSMGYWLINPHEALLISRFFSILCSLLSVFFIMKIGTLLKNKLTGYLSGLFYAVTYMDVWLSHIAKADTLIIFTVIASTYFILKIYHSSKIPNYIYPSIFIALSSAIKFNNIILLLPLFLAHFFAEKRENKKFFEIIFNKKLILSFFITFTFILIFNPLLIWKPKEVFLSFMYEATVGGKHYQNLIFKLLDGWKFHLFNSLTLGTGITLFFIGIIGAYFLFKEDTKKALIFYTFPFLFFILLGNVPRHYARYAAFVIPFFVISAAFIWSNFLRQKNKFLTSFLTILIILPNLIYDIDIDILMFKKNNSLIVGEFINKNISPESTVGHFGDCSYAKVTKIKNRQIEINSNQIPDYLIVYYNRPLSENETKFIDENYTLLKYFKVDKSNKKRSMPTEDSFLEIKTLNFERFRCDIALYKKK